MKKILLACLLVAGVAFAQAQTVYYWVGSAPGGTPLINTNANWNTSLDGGGSARASSSTATDILVFDGTNLGGATPTTGPVTVNFNAGITAAQMKFVNGARINIIRSASSPGGTSTINLNGEAGEDFLIESGSSVSFVSTTGSIAFALAPNTTGRVSGDMSTVTTWQFRLGNNSTAGPRSLVFTNGSTFTTNITSASNSYAFGSSTQSNDKWVVFEAGAKLYYLGGHSPMGNSSSFSAIDFRPGSTWYHRATTIGAGSFFNKKSFADIIVQNGGTLTADGPIYKIDNLTVEDGSTFTTHTSGQTVVLGNLVVDGTLTADAASTNELVLAGSTQQTVSGSGTITVGSLLVADKADVVLQNNIVVNTAARVLGKLDLGSKQLTGGGTFATRSAATPATASGDFLAGSFMVTAPLGTFSAFERGMSISGAGLASNTTITDIASFVTPTADTLYLSQPAVAAGTGVALSISRSGATLATAHTNGFEAASGAVALGGNKTYAPGTNYIINGATAHPVGLTTAAPAGPVEVGSLTLNAAVTTNASITIQQSLQVNGGKVTIRPGDVVRIASGATLAGTFDAGRYFATSVDAQGAKGVLQLDNVSGNTLFPVGSAANYLPVSISPAAAADFSVTAFEGITTDGTPQGTPLNATQKLMVVDAVWDISPATAPSDAVLSFGWNDALEGATFTTFASSEIGVIQNNGSSWSQPAGTADNSANTATHTVTAFGRFGIGAKPPTEPFVFNPIPDKTYGDADFSGGAISVNTTTPIVYTSSNAAVATVVNGNIHITGTGTTNITAAQAGDGFYPAATATQPLTVQKAALTITAEDKIKPEGDPNPALTASYSGFVYGETAAVLATSVVLSTTATTASPVGTYPITPSGATAANYTITFVNGVMTVNPRQPQTITFAALPAKTYGAADFAAGATSTNATIPITYTSSNTGVATVSGSTIRIVGAGTTTITASQAGSPLYHAATPVAQVLTVNKANLTVRAYDTTRAHGAQNPEFRVSYSGFVRGEGVSNLATVPVVSTTAVVSSAPGYYPITLSGGVSNNYSFIYTPARLTVLPPSGAEQTHLQAFMSNSSTLTVRVFATEPDLANVVIYDLGGKPVLTKNVFLAKGFMNFTLPVGHLAAGAYTVSVRGSIVQLRKNITIVK